jgi:hypothetical protein
LQLLEAQGGLQIVGDFEECHTRDYTSVDSERPTSPDVTTDHLRW